MMTSSKKQKRNVLTVGIITMLIFLGYVILQNVNFKTEWKYEEYNNGYKLVSYKQAFNDNSTEIIIPSQYEGKDVVAINDRAFYNNKKIEKVTIPDTVTELGSSVFKACKNLQAVDLSKNIEKMGGECFKDCKSLTSIILPDSLNEIRGETFKGCSSLKTVVLPQNITEIKGNTFENCSSLESIEIPNGVTRIAAHAFYGCSSLSSVFVPDSVVEIGSSAFRLCSKLEIIELPEGVSINERAFKESPTRLLKKQIPDDMWADIENEVNNKGDYEAVYVIYEKQKGENELVIDNNTVYIIDDKRFEETIKDEYALRELTESEELVEYLEQAKDNNATNVLWYFYSEIASEKVGYTYFVTAETGIDDVIATQKNSESQTTDETSEKTEIYDSVQGVTIDFEATTDITIGE